MGSCQYRFNPSETYQRTGPGMGIETHCGGQTYAICDEPEMLPHTVPGDEGEPQTVYEHTGNWLPRANDDPYCPGHGGTPPPPPRILTRAELIGRALALEAHRRDYVAELDRAGLEIPAALQVAPAIEAVHEGAS